MFFTRIHTYYFPVRKEELKSRLAGKHVKIHNLDFEIFERGRTLSIIPHAEQVETIKTLPITSVAFKEEGDTTKVVVTSHMRMLDSGGPLVVLLFCAFMALASVLLYNVDRGHFIAYMLLGTDIGIFALFCIRLQLGYFDYVHKVRDYIKSKAEPAVPGVLPFA